MKKLLMLLLLFVLGGCATLQHQQTYRQSAPTPYPKTARVMVFEYRNVSLQEIYDLLYSDFLIIGRSEFTGPYEDPRASIEFAKSIGADVFVSAAQFKETRTSFVPTMTPTANTAYISGFTSTGPFYGTANTYGTHTTMIPMYIDRYAQSGLYLKNVNHITPLWEKTRSDYKETGSDALSGIWYNDSFELKLYRSGAQMVGFFNTHPKGKDLGRVDDLKMIFNPETGAGVYIMADRTPQPAKIKLNKFGFLEADITGQNDSYSFARR